MGERQKNPWEGADYKVYFRAIDFGQLPFDFHHLAASISSLDGHFQRKGLDVNLGDIAKEMAELETVTENYSLNNKVKGETVNVVEVPFDQSAVLREKVMKLISSMEVIGYGLDNENGQILAKSLEEIQIFLKDAKKILEGYSEVKERWEVGEEAEE